MKDEVIKWLRHVGDDFAPDDPDQDTHPECEGQNKEDPECCPAHKDCGLCRFEYMKQKGWLSELAQLP